MKGYKQTILGIFLPVSVFLIFWYFLVLLSITIDFILTILGLCFRNLYIQSIVGRYIIPIVFVILLLDIFVSFNTGFIKNGKIITQRKQILQNYVFSLYFWFDLIAVVVSLLEIIFKNFVADQIPFFNLLVFIKVVKISEFDTLIKKYIIKSAILNLYYQMFKNLLLLSLVCHVIGSFFFYIDLVLIDLNWYPSDQLWIINSACYPNINELPLGWQYVYSFYYACVTMSGTAYGDLVPLNPSQTAYTFGSVALPMVVYAYLFSVIYNAIADTRAKSIEAKKYKKMASYYLRDLEVDTKLKNRVLNYLTYSYQKKLAVGNEFMEDVPPGVKSRYMKTIIENGYDFNIFINLTRPTLDFQTIKELVYNIIQEEGFSERQSLISKTKNKLYFIQSGKVVEVIRMRSAISKPVKQRTFIGAFAFFTGQVMSPVAVETNSFTVCQSIDYEKFKKLVKQKQVLKQSYNFQRDEVLLYGHLDLIKEQCFFCDEATHKFEDCPKLRPSITVQNCIKKELERNELTSKHIAKRPHIASKKIKQIESSRKIRENMVDIQKGQKQMGIQTDQPQYNQQLQEFEGIFNWRTFYHSHSLS